MKSFDVWVIPDRRKVLVTDRPGYPVGSISCQTFSKWVDAVDYASRICLTTYIDYHVDYDNDAGRYVEWEIENELI